MTLELAVTMDSEGVVQEWTSLAEGLFGYSSAQAVGCSLGDLIVPEAMRPYHEMGLRRYAQTREARCVGDVVEIEAVHQQGHFVPIYLRIDALAKGDEVSFQAHISDQNGPV